MYDIKEKHAKKPDGDISKFFDDKTHLYKLGSIIYTSIKFSGMTSSVEFNGRFVILQIAIYPDNTFKIYVDDQLINSGSLLEDFQ